MTAEQNTTPPPKSGILGFWQELRRRKVIRVATVYLITGWLIIQIADTTFASFGIPDWAFRFVTLMVVLGFPVALIIAWAFELTPDGIKTSKSAAADKESAAPSDNESKALTKKRNWLAYGFAALLPTLIFGTLAAYFYIQAGNSGSEAVEHESVEQSIAVMPLVNMSAHEENVYFAGGIHEDILTNLSRIKNLQVKSRTSMLKYAASDLTLSEIGKELGVNYIVEGSVRRIGNHVRITVQLIDASNDNHLWANNFERELVNVFTAQTELAREISNSLHLEIQPDTIEKIEGMPTSSVKAYDLYIKVESIEKTEGRNEGSMERMAEMLEKAVAADPNFVEAWAILQRLYDHQLDRVKRRGWFVGEGEDVEAVKAELTAKSKHAMEMAIKLDPDNVETLLSTVVDHAWPISYDEQLARKVVFDRIISTHPEHAKTWYHLGWWYEKLSRFEGQDVEAAIKKSNEAFEEAIRLDPFNARMVEALLTLSRRLGDEEKITFLSERLKQILPETAADRKLARVSWLFKRNQIITSFLETADESYLEEYKKGYEQALESDDFAHKLFRYDDERIMSALNDDEEGLIELADTPIDLNQNEWAPLVISDLKVAAMQVYLYRGDNNQARLLAKSILQLEDHILHQSVSFSTRNIASLAIAYAVLGNTNKARELIDVRLDDTTSGFNFSRLIRALAHFDAERAVELAFGERARNPNSLTIDYMAAFQMYSHPFLAHPRVQEYYVKQDKWIDYLAERVPEYAKFKSKTNQP